MKDQPVRATGGCLCGRVRYEADVFLKSGYYCHCGICQRTTGQAGEMAIPIKSGTLKFVNEEPNYYVSSDLGKRGFCPECGSRIVWKALDPALDWVTNVTVGTLDNRAEAIPTRHIYVDTKMPWHQLADSLPQFREDEMDAVIELWRLERCNED